MILDTFLLVELFLLLKIILGLTNTTSSAINMYKTWQRSIYFSKQYLKQGSSWLSSYLVGSRENIYKIMKSY